jgi:long-subunit acyl-CoA synthetase (AMP-forming)
MLPNGQAIDPRDGVPELISQLRRAGLSRGTRLAVLQRSGPRFVTTLLACLEAGVTFVPLHPGTPPSELQDRLATAAACALIDEAGAIRAHPDQPRELSLHPAVILFTSGSQGSGHAVALSEEALLHVATTHHAELGFPPGTPVLSYLPWSHAFGFTLELLMGLLFEARLEPVEAQQLPQALARTRDAFLFSVPRILERLEDSTLESLAGGIIGGAPVRGELRRRLARTRLRVGYGQTECGPGVCLGRPGEWDEDDFIGRPVGCEVALRPDSADAQDSQLFVRGSNLASGYVTGSHHAPATDPTGWRATGDLVTSTGDGYLFRGRRDELFKLDNGRMVNPVPLEIPFDGRVFLVPIQGQLQPLVRGGLPKTFSLPLPHLAPREMPEQFWTACTTPTGKLSRRKAEQLFTSA